MGREKDIGIRLGIDTELWGESGGSGVSLGIATGPWRESGTVGLVWGLPQGYREKVGQWD